MAYASLLRAPHVRDKVHGIPMLRANMMVDLFVDNISADEDVLDPGCGFGDISKVLIDRKKVQMHACRH